MLTAAGRCWVNSQYYCVVQGMESTDHRRDIDYKYINNFRIKVARYKYLDKTAAFRRPPVDYMDILQQMLA